MPLYSSNRLSWMGVHAARDTGILVDPTDLAGASGGATHLPAGAGQPRWSGSVSALPQELAHGMELRVTELLGQDAETRELAQMGLESGRKVRLLWSNRQHLLLSVAGRTLGLSRRLGSKVVVTADTAA